MLPVICAFGFTELVESLPTPACVSEAGNLLDEQHTYFCCPIKCNPFISLRLKNVLPSNN